MSPKFDFKDWLKQQHEMTTTTSVGGGGTFTNDIANFSRPLFGGDPVGRQWADLDDEDDKKRKKRKKD